MIFHKIRLLASYHIIPYFFRKLGKMAQNLSSAAVVIGALRVSRRDKQTIKVMTSRLWVKYFKVSCLFI